MAWKLSSIGMNATADQYLVFHKFGMVRHISVCGFVNNLTLFPQYLDSRKDLDTEKTIKSYLERLHKRMNPKNLRLYVDAYLR